MVIRHHSKSKFTPERLISAPRPSSAVPNDDGSLALYTTTSYSIEADVESHETRVLDLKTGRSTLFSSDSSIKEPQWLSGNELLWLKPVSGGKTQIWTGNAGTSEKNEYLVGTIVAPISRVRVGTFERNGPLVLAFSAPKSPDGRLFNPETAPKPASTAREYETAMVRWWDTWYQKEKSSLWFTTFSYKNHRHNLSGTGPVDVLAGTKLQFPWTTTSPLGEGGSYDISSEGIVFSTLNQEDYDPTFRAVTDIWYYSFSHTKEVARRAIRRIVVPGWDGLASGGVISPDGKSVAFLKGKSLDPAYANPSIFVVGIKDNDVNGESEEILGAREAVRNWDRSPTALYWARGGKELVTTAEEHGRVKLFKVPYPTARGLIQQSPIPLSEIGSVSAVYPFSKKHDDNRLLITRSSIIESAVYATVDTNTGSVTPILNFASNSAQFFLDPSQVKEFLFRSTRGDYTIHSWLILPSDFLPSKKYPVAFLIHGGPISSWSDSWSTRWNPALFAEQGYIVVMPNITGSTGYGRHFAESVVGEWGGRPYYDIEDCVSFVENTYDFVDPNRFVALGASYGGYMMNWIQGQPLAKRFRTLVCHDGIFSLPSLLGSDYTFDLGKAFNGNLWENIKGWDEADPARHTHNWTQPMLIIHSDKDFRCPINAGLAAFNICKMKGIPARFLNFPDENHFVLGRANSLHWNRTVLGWINKWAENEGDGKVELQKPATEY